MMAEPRQYIDAQLNMAAKAECAMIEEGKRLDAIEREYGRLDDSEYAEHLRLTRTCMGHYRLALHAAGLLDARHLLPF